MFPADSIIYVSEKYVYFHALWLFISCYSHGSSTQDKWGKWSKKIYLYMQSMNINITKIYF